MNRKCFVLMPFAPEFDGVWSAVVRPTVQGIGDQCTRADDFMKPGVIINDILNSIKDADYLLADLTNRNPNVFYELGIAHALNKPVILLARHIDEVPFDLRHRRIEIYQDTAKGATELSSRLKKVISSL